MLLTVFFAYGASLDNLEIGGPWGSPVATDATAAWWNPAGMAAGRGTRFLVEGAPTFATVGFTRADPHGGTDTLRMGGAVPFGGVVSDFGVEGLAVGLSMAVPFVRGGHSTAEPDVAYAPGSAVPVGTGAGHYALRDGMAQALAFTLSGAYQIRGRVALGGGVSLVRSSWTALVDSETLPDLDAAIRAEGEDPGYTDDDLETVDYATALSFPELSDLTVSFSVGAHVQATERVSFALAYLHGARVDNEGDVTLTFGCPPETDVVGRFGIEDLGLCHTVVPARASVAYALPGRLHGGVRVQPTEHVTVEAIGGWVRWHVFDDYTITIHDAGIDNADAQALIEQRRTWARANRDSGWAGVDVKGEVGRLTAGGRITVDRAAVPDTALSPNNYDANELLLSGLVAVRVAKPIQLAASYTHHFVATRTVTDSGFGMTLGDDRAEDRWYYPQMNGTYTGAIDRIGLQLRGGF